MQVASFSLLASSYARYPTKVPHCLSRYLWTLGTILTLVKTTRTSRGLLYLLEHEHGNFI